MASINTNYGALVALQNLNKTTMELDVVQNRINTGLKVASAKDNGAVYAIAQAQRSRVAAISSVADGIDRTTNVIDTGLSAGETISDLLVQMKEKAVAAQAGDLSSTQRAALATDFTELRTQITQIANSATFNGANVVNGLSLAAGSNPLNVLLSDLASTSSALVHGFSGAAPGAGSPVPSRNATLTTASEGAAAANDMVDGDFINITRGGTTWSIENTAGKTINTFVNEVNAATAGAVTAVFDETTGQISFYGNDNTTAFTVAVTSLTGGAGVARASTFLEATSAAGVTNNAPGTTRTITAYDFTVGGTGALNGASAWDIGTSATTASTAAGLIDTALTTLNSNLATLGSQSKALATQKEFLGKLSASVEKGIGQLVDADLAKESARLQSLQVKQQLGAQALSIANSAPSIVLSFFR